MRWIYYIDKSTNGVVGTGSSFTTNGLVSDWLAGSDEAKVVAEEIEKAGLVIDAGFINGATSAKESSHFFGRTSLVSEGLIQLGNYDSEHACDVALGSSVASVFANISSGGSEQVAVSAVMTAVLNGDWVALELSTKALAEVVVDPLLLISDVSNIGLTREQLVDIMAFIIYKSFSIMYKENPESTIDGQFIVGALVYGINSLVCDGIISGGYQLLGNWSGL